MLAFHAWLDGDGFLFLRGRLQDRIVLANGMNVYPEDVEGELALEDGVEDCAVVGLPDAAGNARVHALIIAAAGSDDVRRERAGRAVRNANGRLAPHQRISGFTLWDAGDFPRTSLRKVKRHEALASLTGEAPAPASTRPPRSESKDRLVRLSRILADLGNLPVEAVTLESDLTLDLGLDSLSRVELAVLLEDELGVSLEDGDLARAGTTQPGGFFTLTARQSKVPGRAQMWQCAPPFFSK